jgi:hypothetical protein
MHEAQPEVVVEVGTWKGASVLRMVKLSHELGIKTSFVCVDTWLGSSADVWLAPDDRAQLLLRGGYPTMFRQFIANVIAHDATDVIYPLPMTSTAGARLLARLGVTADVVYVDAGHEEEEVAADLDLYWKLLHAGGVFFGHDYTGRWSGVVRAVDRFCAMRKLDLSLDKGNFWLVRKPASPPAE